MPYHGAGVRTAIAIPWRRTCSENGRQPGNGDIPMFDHRLWAALLHDGGRNSPPADVALVQYPLLQFDLNQPSFAPGLEPGRTSSR